MVGTPFLLAVGRVSGGVSVDEDAPWPSLSAPLTQVQAQEGNRDAIAGLEVNRILEPGEG
jgi:hypothetical protein